VAVKEGLGEAYEQAGRLLGGSRRLRIVHHVDLDGAAAAAVVARGVLGRPGSRVRFRATGVRSVRRAVLGELRGAAGGGETVVVADLGPGGRGDAEAVASGLRLGQRLVWLDHHEWPPGAREALVAAGAVVVLDRSRVTAEIACRAVGCMEDEVSRTIVEVARADDSCGEDPLGLAERWRVVLRVLGPRAAERAAESLARGDLWPQWAREVYERHAAAYYRELREQTRLYRAEWEGVRVAVLVPSPRVSGCDLERAGLVPGPGEVDVVVVAYPRGLSIRTWGRLRADCIASRLGGGGHHNAAGAPRPSTTMGPAQIARMVARAAAACLSGGGGGEA
jgi:hypothetical protein